MKIDSIDSNPNYPMNLKRQTINLQAFEDLIKDSKIIAQHKKWPKIIRKGDDYIKFFSYGNRAFGVGILTPLPLSLSAMPTVSPSLASKR